MSNIETASRKEWAQYLPLLQAFVAGAAIQELGYNGGWEDTDTIYQIRQSKWRVKPANLVQGEWVINYVETDLGSKTRLEGVARWSGADQDTPPWPRVSQREYLASTLKFEAKKP